MNPLLQLVHSKLFYSLKYSITLQFGMSNKLFNKQYYKCATGRHANVLLVRAQTDTLLEDRIFDEAATMQWSGGNKTRKGDVPGIWLEEPLNFETRDGHPEWVGYPRAHW